MTCEGKYCARSSAYRCSNDGPGHSACASESLLGRHEHIWHVLVLAKQREMQQNLKGLGVRGHDDELGDAAVEGLGRLVGTLLQLLVIACLQSNFQSM